MANQEVLSLTKARFAEIDLDRMNSIRNKALGVLGQSSGLLSLTLWEKFDDPFAFMIATHFSSEEHSLTAWDNMLRSPVFEVVNDLLTETPSTLRFYVDWTTGLSLDASERGTFCSISTRIADLGFDPKLKEELKNIFEELKLIPGFKGGLTGQLVDVSDEILGLVLWESKLAFEASIPKKSMYRIDLYQRVL